MTTTTAPTSTEKQTQIAKPFVHEATELCERVQNDLRACHNDPQQVNEILTNFGAKLIDINQRWSNSYGEMSKGSDHNK